MNFNSEFYLAIVFIILYVNISLVLILALRKLLKHEGMDRHRERSIHLFRMSTGKLKSWGLGKAMESYSELRQSIKLSDFEKDNMDRAINVRREEKKAKRKLKSIFKTTRIQGAVSLGVLRTDNGRLALESAIKTERDFSAKLYIANALSDIGDYRSLPVLLDTLINAHRWYRDKVNMLICGFENLFHDYLPQIILREEFEIKELIIEFSSVYVSEDLRNYILEFVEGYEDKIARMEIGGFGKKKNSCFSCIHGKTMMLNGDRVCQYNGVVSPAYSCRKYVVYPSSFYQVDNYKKLVYRAVYVMKTSYCKELNHERFLNHDDIAIKRIAVESLCNFNSSDKLDTLIGYLSEEEVGDVAAKAIRQVLERNPGNLKVIYDKCVVEERENVKKHFIDILSNRIEYLIMKLRNSQGQGAEQVLVRILIQGKTSQFIWFMNKNHDPAIEVQLIEIVKSAVHEKPELENIFAKFLEDRLAEKCHIKPHVQNETENKEEKNLEFIKIMYIMVGAIAVLFPAIYCVRHFQELMSFGWMYHIRNYIIDFNYFLAFYSIAINAIYFILLGLSMWASTKQLKLWRLKSTTMMFKDRMLPTVSIIAPGYNEDHTIVESVHSLLNLKYPDYELIVVNDGSKDMTMDILIKEFGLELVDRHYEHKLNTMPVRGIYMNPSIPKLIVVDKENGGKADALNAGINVSTREYFCGIDADSLLEDDALLKLSSLTLDSSVEIPALGGNILPINGCSVDRGVITKMEIPKKRVTRLQTVEYVRSFMTGRLGWAAMDCMLIISGAFGLFRKDRIVAIGGYLTSKEKYGKNTVGEDMEMVVRTRRLMYEMKLKHVVGFAFDANCWTQVPEESGSLKKQRQRWGRGLADTMTFHKKMIFNPRYGRIGMIAMPYFFIFELAGPLIEIQGYIMVVLAFFLGYLDAQMALMLFVTTILLGVFMSVSSFVILEKSSVRFRTTDILKLLAYAVIENFGPRQLGAFWRAGAIFKLLSGATGWEKAHRTRFKTNQESKSKADPYRVRFKKNQKLKNEASE